MAKLAELENFWPRVRPKMGNELELKCSKKAWEEGDQAKQWSFCFEKKPLCRDRTQVFITYRTKKVSREIFVPNSNMPHCGLASASSSSLDHQVAQLLSQYPSLLVNNKNIRASSEEVNGNNHHHNILAKLL